MELILGIKQQKETLTYQDENVICLGGFGNELVVKKYLEEFYWKIK